MYFQRIHIHLDATWSATTGTSDTCISSRLLFFTPISSFFLSGASLSFGENLNKKKCDLKFHLTLHKSTYFEIFILWAWIFVCVLFVVNTITKSNIHNSQIKINKNRLHNQNTCVALKRIQTARQEKEKKNHIFDL